jgi:hypothetical protein
MNGNTGRHSPTVLAECTTASHIVMQRHTDQVMTTVPVPNHSIIRVGTLQSMLRQSGVPKEKFLR